MIKKNYIRFDQSGHLEKYFIQPFTATSSGVDIIYVFADFDTSTTQTAYRTYARLLRADGFPIGPINMPAGQVNITLEEVNLYGVGDYATYNELTKLYDIPCRMLIATDQMLTIAGSLGLTVVYEEVDALGKVTKIAAQGYVTIPVTQAVPKIFIEDEYNDIKNEMLPRDLGDITDGVALGGNEKFLGKQYDATKLLTIDKIKEYIEKFNVINLGAVDNIETDANNILKRGVYRYEHANGAFGDSGLLINDFRNGAEQFQMVIQSDRIKTRKKLLVNDFEWTDWNDFVLEDEKQNIRDNADNIGITTSWVSSVATNLNTEISRSKNKDTELTDSINTVNADLQSTKTGRLKTAEDKITALEGNTVKNTGKTSQNVDGKVIVDSLETDIIGKKTKDTTPIIVNEKLKYNTDIDSLSNDTTLATTKFVKDRVADLLNQLAGGELDEALDTLKELQIALNNDPNFASTVATELGKKVDKTTTINAKPLNTNIVLDKTDIGLPNVLDIKQASKVEHDELVSVVNQKVNNADLNPVFSIDIDRLWFVNEPGPNWQYYTSELVSGLHYFADNAGYNYPLWVGIKSIYQGDAGVAIECYYANNKIYEEENLLTEITPNTNDIYYVINGDNFAGKYIKWDGTIFYESDNNKTLSIPDFPNVETPITNFEGYAILHGNNNAEIYLHRLNEPEAEINKTAVYYGIVRDSVGNPAFSGYEQIAYNDYVDNLVTTLRSELSQC